MEAMLVKLAPRIPALITRALAGDPTAAATLAAIGIAAGVELIRQQKR